MTDTGIGASVRRTEDQRFLTGSGHYTDDFDRPGQAFVHLIRSPHPHAKIARVDTQAAQAAPGVVGIVTGADLAADGVGGVPCGFAPDGKQNAPPRPILATDRVRFVGEAVVAVIANSLDLAKDAADKVVIDYEPLPVVVTATDAAGDAAPLLHDEAPANICTDWQLGDKAATDAAFAGAAHVTTLKLVNNRKTAVAIEPRAALGDYDRARDELTLHTSSQIPHITRLLIAAFILGVPEAKLRVVAPDVGGGFGSKISQYPEEALVVWAARRFGRPVKWTAERSESMISDTHGRDHVTTAQLALDDAGKMIGLRVDTTANLGAYLSTFGALSCTYLYGVVLSGLYAIGAIHCAVRAVFTNTVPIDAERGAGRPEATFLVERLVDMAARELGIEPAKLRRRNLIQPDAFPYQTPVVVAYDSGDYPKLLEAGLKHADHAGFAARREQSRARGMLRGIGISAYVEACGLAPSAVAGAIGASVGLYETAELRFSLTGSVQVMAGTMAQGQGHQTTYAQIVSSRLGIPLERIEVSEGDTDRVQWGHGTYGSRSLAVGGSAVAIACDRVIEKARVLAAHMLEAAEDDVTFGDGKFTIAGTDREKTLDEVVMAAGLAHNVPAGFEPGLDQRSSYDPTNFTFPAGCHVCEVEIDPETGKTTIVKFTAVDDFGELVNPMIVEGQVHGGIAHGVGQALLEEIVYDTSGQPLSGSLMDYMIPRADDLPSFAVDYQVTPCPHNPLGVKGCGEAGAIAAPAAVINAVADALDVDHIDMPATPQRVWQALQHAPQAAE